MAPAAMSPFTSGNRVSKVLGHLKTGQIFVNSAPSKERFRDWYKDHKKGGDK